MSATPLPRRPDATVRQSIQPTYDRQKTGDRFTVETRVGNRLVKHDRIPDPFIHTRTTLGWRDLLRGLLRRKLEVTVIVGGDREVIEDVMELDADYLGVTRCTRRQEWGAHLDGKLRDFAARAGEHDTE